MYAGVVLFVCELFKVELQFLFFNFAGKDGLTSGYEPSDMTRPSGPQRSISR